MLEQKRQPEVRAKRFLQDKREDCLSVHPHWELVLENGVVQSTVEVPEEEEGAPKSQELNYAWRR